MNKNYNEFWSDKTPYYIVYQDKEFIKNIYAQLYSEFPDIGQIAYIGTNTKRISKDYCIDGEKENAQNYNKNDENENTDNNYNKNINLNDRKKAGIKICDSDEESQIREYANIREIKEMNNMLFYKRLLRRLIYTCAENKCRKLCHIYDNIQLYEDFKEDEDIFVKMKEDCVWLKKTNMDTTVINISHIFGKVHMVGYVLEEKTNTNPRVIKALAIYT